MAAQTEVCITEDEAKLYDRQIRLWGLDAQKRLRASRVLICGLGGLGCEIAKNLVLAGINSLVVLDPEPLTENDLSSQFLAPESTVGANRAESSLNRLQRLNPMVEVKVDTSLLSSKPSEFFTDNFDIVIITKCPSRDVLTKVNKICRDSNIKFFCGDVFGYFGYCFQDLKFHEFVHETTVQEKPKTDQILKKEIEKKLKQKMDQEEVLIDDDTPIEDSEEPAAKQAKISIEGDVNGQEMKEAKEDEPTKKLIKRQMRFPSLEDSLNFNWSTKSRTARAKKMDPSFFVLQVLLEFQSREGTSPNANMREDHLKLLTSLKSSIESKYNLPEGKIPDEILEILFSELSPVSAIVGGVLAQEVIKAISNRDIPLKNFFFYNPIESSGVVEIIGKSKEKFPTQN